MPGTGGGYQESRYAPPTVPYRFWHHRRLGPGQTASGCDLLAAEGPPGTTTVGISAAGGGLVQGGQAGADRAV